MQMRERLDISVFAFLSIYELIKKIPVKNLRTPQNLSHEED